MNKIGILSFINKNNKLEILYPEYIEEPNFHSYPFDIKEQRNKLIMLCGIQIIVALFASLFLISRRNLFYLFIICMSVSIALMGLLGSLRFNGKLLAFHCVSTISLFGAFFLYEIFYFLFVDTSEIDKRNRLSDSFMLFFYTVPYAYDVFVGFYNYNMLKRISEYLKKITTANPMEMEFKDEEIDDKKINDHLLNVDQNLCIICCEKKRDAVLIPCGHKIACCECLGKLLNMNAVYHPSCPFCRSRCTNFTKIFEC